jgi:hypothetical protein
LGVGPADAFFGLPIESRELRLIVAGNGLVLSLGNGVLADVKSVSDFHFVLRTFVVVAIGFGLGGAHYE